MVLNVGDQWSDLKGKPEAEYSVKYPDPFTYSVDVGVPVVKPPWGLK